MQYRQLGKSALHVSSIGVGFWGIVGGEYWGPQDEADTFDTVNSALDGGINLFDTAENYGDGYSELMLGRALKGRRTEAIIATKVRPHHLESTELRKACERSLVNLQTDYIDIYQIHWPNRDVPYEETMATLLDLQREGKIRVIGVSNFGKRDMSEMLTHGRFESNQLPYNLLWRAIEFDIQPQCVDEQIGILAYSPLMQALLTGRYHSADEMPPSRTRTRHFRGDREGARHGLPGQETAVFQAIEAIRQICAEINQPMARVALAWLLHKPAIISVLAGARNADQVHSNASAASLSLSQEIMGRLDEVTDALKQAFGSDPDMWQNPANSRYR